MAPSPLPPSPPPDSYCNRIKFYNFLVKQIPTISKRGKRETGGPVALTVSYAHINFNTPMRMYEKTTQPSCLCPYFYRYLSAWLGLLLCWRWSSCSHVDLHLALLLCWKKPQACHVGRKHHEEHQFLCHGAWPLPQILRFGRRLERVGKRKEDGLEKRH